MIPLNIPRQLIEANYGANVSNITSFQNQDGAIVRRDFEGDFNPESTASVLLDETFFMNITRLVSIVYDINSSVFQDLNETLTPQSVIYSLSTPGDPPTNLETPVQFNFSSVQVNIV